MKSFHKIKIGLITVITLACVQFTHAAPSTFADGVVIGGTALSAGLLLDVNGKIGATQICDANGANCTSPNNLGSPWLVYGANTYRNGGNVGIGVLPSQKLDVNGNAWVRGGHIYLGSTGLQDLYGDNSATLYYDSNHSTITSMMFRDAQNTRYGHVYGDSDGANFGLLDGNGAWSYLARKGNYTELFVGGASYLNVGPRGVFGDYGTIQVNGGGKNGWEGYNINGRAVFMHDGGYVTGLYDDVYNRWILYSDIRNHVRLYYAGHEKFRTESWGARVHGNLYASSLVHTSGSMRATHFCYVNGGNCIDMTRIRFVNNVLMYSVHGN